MESDLLNHFEKCGSLCHFRHWFNENLWYMPDLHEYAKQSQLLWLLDLIAIHIEKESDRGLIEDVLSIKLDRLTDQSLSLSFIDAKSNAIETELKICNTDFDLESLEFSIKKLDNSCWFLELE